MKNFLKKLASYDGSVYLKKALGQQTQYSAYPYKYTTVDSSGLKSGSNNVEINIQDDEEFKFIRALEAVRSESLDAGRKDQTKEDFYTPEQKSKISSIIRDRRNFVLSRKMPQQKLNLLMKNIEMAKKAITSKSPVAVSVMSMDDDEDNVISMDDEDNVISMDDELTPSDDQVGGVVPSSTALPARKEQSSQEKGRSLLQNAEYFLHNGKYNEAVKSIEYILTYNLLPSTPDLYYLLGMSKSRDNDKSGAMEALRHCISAGSGSSKYHEAYVVPAQEELKKLEGAQ